jgi:hypothetical protein
VSSKLFNREKFQLLKLFLMFENSVILKLLAPISLNHQLIVPINTFHPNLYKLSFSAFYYFLAIFKFSHCTAVLSCLLFFREKTLLECCNVARS